MQTNVWLATISVALFAMAGQVHPLRLFQALNMCASTNCFWLTGDGTLWIRRTRQLEGRTTPTTWTSFSSMARTTSQRFKWATQHVKSSSSTRTRWKRHRGEEWWAISNTWTILRSLQTSPTSSRRLHRRSQSKRLAFDDMVALPYLVPYRLSYLVSAAHEGSLAQDDEDFTVLLCRYDVLATW